MVSFRIFWVVSALGCFFVDSILFVVDSRQPRGTSGEPAQRRQGAESSSFCWEGQLGLGFPLPSCSAVAASLSVYERGHIPCLLLLACAQSRKKVSSPKKIKKCSEQ